MYTSATLSLAALERFVHTDPDLEPADLVAVFVDVDDDIPFHSVDIGQFPPDWRQYPAPDALGRLGEKLDRRTKHGDSRRALRSDSA